MFEENNVIVDCGKLPEVSSSQQTKNHDVSVLFSLFTLTVSINVALSFI